MRTCSLEPNLHPKPQYSCSEMEAEVEVGDPQEACGLACISLVNNSKKMISNKVDDKDQHPRSSSDRHTCTVVHVCTLQISYTRAHTQKDGTNPSVL